MTGVRVNELPSLAFNSLTLIINQRHEKEAVALYGMFG